MKTNEIKLSVIPEQELTQIKEELGFIRSALTKKTEEDISNSFLESKNIPKLLGISSKTWQTYRDNGTIPFIQFGSKIWVKRIDLESFMDSHYIKKAS